MYVTVSGKANLQTSKGEKLILSKNEGIVQWLSSEPKPLTMNFMSEATREFVPFNYKEITLKLKKRVFIIILKMIDIATFLLQIKALLAIVSLTSRQIYNLFTQNPKEHHEILSRVLTPKRIKEMQGRH